MWQLVELRFVEPASSAAIKPKVDGDITLFSWDGYVAPAVLKGFEKKYGVKVNTVPYDSDEAMVQKLAAGLPYDVVTTNSAFMKQLTGANLLARIDAPKLANWDNVLGYFQDPSYDPGASSRSRTVTAPPASGTSRPRWR